MITTTLNKIRKHSPCAGSWEVLLKGLGKSKADDEDLPILRILEICGLNDALWALRATDDEKKICRLFAVFCARSVIHITNDWRSVQAVNVAERYAHGMATEEQLYAAWAAAWAAARSPAWAAARAAAWSFAYRAACDAACDTACDAACDAACAAARIEQEKYFRALVGA